MARKSSNKPDQAPRRITRLVVSRADAEAKIAARIKLGDELFARSIESFEDLKKAQMEFYTWSDFNTTLLNRLFDSDEYEREYTGLGGGPYARTPSLHDEIQGLHEEISIKSRRLESIKNRLELIGEPLRVEGVSDHKPAITGGTAKAFVVHGHDEGARESLARFLDKVGVEPIILHEMASGGGTIIEKLERYSDVAFAVVLLTPDDVGAVATSKDRLSSRARQNVILELGYFIGKLGRSHVCVLLKGDIELPSDMLGVVHVPMTDADGWRLRLGKELRNAGFEIDLNKL
jgi:predicted nucleotide-binding protein